MTAVTSKVRNLPITAAILPFIEASLKVHKLCLAVLRHRWSHGTMRGKKKYQLVTLSERIHQHSPQIKLLPTKPQGQQIDLSSANEGQDPYAISETTA